MRPFTFCTIMNKLKIGEVLELCTFEYFRSSDDLLKQEIKEILDSGARSGRTTEKRKEDITNGLALQYAVASELDQRGYDVLLPPREIMHYDLIVQGIKVDVKGRFPGAKFWQQSQWECQECTKRKEDILYLCIDVLQNNTFVHAGQCWSYNLEPSKFNSPWVKIFYEIL